MRTSLLSPCLKQISANSNHSLASITSYSNGSLISKRHFYYYSNGLLNNFSTNFGSSSKSSDSNSKNVQFIPNYRMMSLTPSNSIRQSHISTSTAATVNESTSESTNQTGSVIAKMAKTTLACHPQSSSNDSSTSHIPFEVKSKSVSNIPQKSILQQILNGEKKTFKQLKDPYLALTKPNLTFLIMLSSICSYALAPQSGSVSEFIFLTTGTLLASGAANAINMAREPNFDKQMQRTQSRPVVKGLVTPNEAFAFAGITGTLGCTILYFGVNPVVSALGFLNIVLYSWVYTSLKRKSILNTWVGAVVGAIPPLMGWATCSSLAEPGAWCLALLLYAWQFPHFNTLSHNIKGEYQKAGYVMTAFKNPMLNARVALRYSLMMFPICFGMSYFGVTDPYFIIDSSVLNGWLTYMSFKFWWQQKQNYSSAVKLAGGPTKEMIDLSNVYAKKTFWSSIWQLPVVLVLAMLHKKGQWDRLFGFNENETPLSSN
ncbi:hypothetical protein CANARDRAFT_26446 [[Candida] arabinofermentans NRRL YB-2248]|uniref:Protoheme IX farnesyltransferase, mitochondrial n=1 Tax=[Candida] arabinofermentans NRRL YB-2248 TaxID=983967 RepID=A0A1E4T988_9ASCO|nr:hypothetical protein CANARDRAFT_26446 [[Candida] arabinofermentans NRRL YB-2248]